MHRGGTLTMRYSEVDGMVLTSLLSFKTLEAQYSAEAKFMYVGPTVKATAIVEDVTINVTVHQPATPSARLNLTQFSIEQVGFVDAKIGGLGFFGKFVKLLILPIVNAVKDAIGLA